MVHREELTVATKGRGFYDITEAAQRVVAHAGVEVGACTLFVHHTSASLLINENADTDVRGDLEHFFSRLVRDGDELFAHQDEGPDDMSAHIRSVLTATSLTIPVFGGRLDLGTWQGIYLWEHRYAPHRRRISLTVLG